MMAWAPADLSVHGMAVMLSSDGTLRQVYMGSQEYPGMSTSTFMTRLAHATEAADPKTPDLRKRDRRGPDQSLSEVQ